MSTAKKPRRRDPMAEALTRAPAARVLPTPEELTMRRAHEGERRDPGSRHYSQDEAEAELERLIRSRPRAMDR